MSPIRGAIGPGQGGSSFVSAPPAGGGSGVSGVSGGGGGSVFTPSACGCSP